MKKVILALAIVTVLLTSMWVVSRTRAKVPDLPSRASIEVLSQEEGVVYQYIICRCHIEVNVCYGGNLISFRPLCYEGCLVDCTKEQCPI